jgi:hypothetical protein
MSTSAIILKNGQITLDRRLDLVFDKDPLNLNYPALALAPTDYEQVDKQWGAGPVTDQGKEGACVGHGCTQAACAMHGARVVTDDETPDAYAFRWYHVTQHGDQWAGCSKGPACELAPSPESYGGTSVKAGGSLGVHRGLFSEYRWAFGIDEVLKTLTTVGRVIFGVPWFEGMYEAPGGKVVISGSQVGAHCIGSDEIKWSNETVIWQNSWGLGYGVNGRAAISFTDLDRLLREGGEAMVPIAAELGALSQ